MTTHSSTTHASLDLHVVPQDGSRHARRRIDADAPAARDVGRPFGLRERPRRRPVVRDRAHVPERRIAHEPADRAGLSGDQRVVHAADRVGRLPGGQRREDAGLNHLHTDEVVGALGPATRDESRHTLFGIEPHAAVAIRMAIGHQRERDGRAGRLMRVAERREVDVGQGVTVDQEKRVGADDRQRLARAAGGAQDGRLFP